jgi:hypothetical protein
MVADASPLVSVARLVDALPLPPAPGGRRRPWVYGERLSLKALVVALVRRLPAVQCLLAVLAEPTPEMAHLRALFTDEHGRFPSRRTWERRLAGLAERLPAILRAVGAWLLARLRPWPRGGRRLAPERPPGGRGAPPQHRHPGHWTKSGWHGWVYGYKLHLVVTTSDLVWLPLAAVLTPANVADNAMAPTLLTGLPVGVGVLLGDRHYRDPAPGDQLAAEGRVLITTKRGRYPHTDDGVEVRRIFHQLRSHSIENFNSQFKAIFDCIGALPTKGQMPTARFALGAVFLYQLTLYHRYLAGHSLRSGLKSFLLAA